MENLQYFIALLAVLVIGLILIKKITGCIFRIVIAVIMLAIYRVGFDSLTPPLAYKVIKG